MFWKVIRLLICSALHNRSYEQKSREGKGEREREREGGREGGREGRRERSLREHAFVVFQMFDKSFALETLV